MSTQPFIKNYVDDVLAEIRKTRRDVFHLAYIVRTDLSVVRALCEKLRELGIEAGYSDFKPERKDVHRTIDVKWTKEVRDNLGSVNTGPASSTPEHYIFAVVQSDDDGNIYGVSVAQSSVESEARDAACAHAQAIVDELLQTENAPMADWSLPTKLTTTPSSSEVASWAGFYNKVVVSRATCLH